MAEGSAVAAERAAAPGFMLAPGAVAMLSDCRAGPGLKVSDPTRECSRAPVVAVEVEDGGPWPGAGPSEGGVLARVADGGNRPERVRVKVAGAEAEAGR